MLTLILEEDFSQYKPPWDPKKIIEGEKSGSTKHAWFLCEDCVKVTNYGAWLDEPLTDSRPCLDGKDVQLKKSKRWDGIKMNPFRSRKHPAGDMTVLFLAVAAVSVVALVWMGVRLMQQDRALESQQLEDRREAAADRVVAALEQVLSAEERRLAEAQLANFRLAAEDALLFTAGPTDVRVWPENALPYYPVMPGGREAPSRLYAAAEKSEFLDRDYESAIRALRSLIQAEDPVVRAGAQLRRLASPDRDLRPLRYRDPRRGRNLRPRQFQRQTPARVEGHHVGSGNPRHARLPAGRHLEQGTAWRTPILLARRPRLRSGPPRSAAPRPAGAKCRASSLSHLLANRRRACDREILSRAKAALSWGHSCMQGMLTARWSGGL